MKKTLLTLAALTIATTACGGSSGFQGDPASLEGIEDNVPVVDYSQWPLASVISSIGPCADFAGTANDLLWVPTKSNAQADGYGYMSAQVALLTTSTAPPTPDCTTAQSRLDALGTALFIAAQKSTSSDAYSQWSDCMSAGGYPGIGTPAERGTVLAKKLYTTQETESVDAVADRASGLRDDERAMALVDISCQAQTILPVESKMVSEQTASIDEAPSDQAELLRG